MLTSDVLRGMWPHADATTPGLTDGIMAAAPAVFDEFRLTSDLLVAHAMAQFSQECGAGTELVENLNYSAQQLTSTWPTRFGAAKAAAFARDPQRIADEVYNGRMGNRAGSNDGWTYRGRGGSQVTGRDGYARLGARVGIDLLASPDQVNSPANFLRCAVADFILCGCLPFAQNDDVAGVTLHLNGGHIGLAGRTAWLARWEAALDVSGAAARGTLWIQQSLNRLGAEPPLVDDGSYGPLTAAAVRAFQQKKGLDVDGKAGPQTIAAIERALG